MKTIPLFAVLAAILPLMPAAAAVPARTQTLRIDRHAVASPAGRAALDRRIVQAADEVCGTPSQLDLAGQSAAGRCRSATLAAARLQLARRAGGAALAAAAN